MQDIGARYAAGQLAIDIDVLMIDEVADSDFGRDGLARFVHTTVGGNVRMAIDDSGRDVLPFGVDLHSVLGHFDVAANRRNLARLDQHRSVGEHALRSAGPDRGVTKDDPLWLLGDGRAAEIAERIVHGKQSRRRRFIRFLLFRLVVGLLIRRSFSGLLRSLLSGLFRASFLAGRGVFRAGFFSASRGS